MADISMCNAEECPKKDTCYRYNAPANPYWQSYIMWEKDKDFTRECEYYWEMEK